MNNTYIKGRIKKGEFVSELFKQRVESIGGTYEANDCLVNSLNSLTDREFKDAKAILTPNGYLVDKLPAIKPNSGGDATIVRNVSKTRVNSSGLIESMDANVLAPDYLNGVCPVINVEGQATNLIGQSENFNTAYWGTRPVTQDINVFGNLDNIRLTQGSTNPGKGFNITGGLTYYFNFFLRKDGSQATFPEMEIVITDGTTLTKRINFQINKVTGVSATRAIIGNLTFEVLDFNSDYWQVKTTTPTDATDQTYAITYRTAASDTLGGYNPQIGSESTINALQLQDTPIGSYTPNATGASLTRSADNVTVPIPLGVTEIIEKYEDGTTNTITTIPASPYTVPTGKRYEYILMR